MKLAAALRQWDPDQPDTAGLEQLRSELTVDSDAEVLAQALHNFATRLDAFVERERNFTRDASHELRSPLTIIKVAAEVLSDDDTLSVFARRSLTRIQRSVREMEALIESFLVLARESDTGLSEEHSSPTTWCANRSSVSAICSKTNRSNSSWKRTRASRCMRRRGCSRW